MPRQRAVFVVALVLCSLVAVLPAGAWANSGEPVVGLEGFFPTAVNEHGQMIGGGSVGGNGPAFWSKGVVTTLKAPVGEEEYAVVGLNDLGEAVGYGCSSSGGYTTHCDVLTWSNGGAPVIPFYPPANTEGEETGPGSSTLARGYSIDDAGDIGGSITYRNPGAFAGLYAPGGASPEKLTELESVVGISSAGDIAIGPFALTEPYMETSVGGGGPVYSRVCPEAGVVDLYRTSASDGAFVGSLQGEYEGKPGDCANFNTKKPVLHSPNGTLTELPMGGATSATAYGVNASHIVVGALVKESSSRAVMWPVGASGPVELNALLPKGSPWKLITATAINNSGTVVGYGTYEGKYRGFVFHANTLSATITLTGKGGVPLTGAATAVGSSLIATVKVTAPSSNSAPVSAVKADPSLTVDPEGALTMVSGPSPASIDGATLAPGESATYADTYTIAGTGHVKLSVALEGTAEGQPVTGGGSAVAALGQPLEVSVQWLQGGKPVALNQPGGPSQPNTIRLADVEKGEVPQDVTAQVTVTNTSGIAEENVSLNGIPALSYHNPSDARQALPVGVTSGPTPSTPIETLAPGAHATVSFTVHVTANGVFDFSPQVLSSDEGSAGTSVSQGVGTLTALPTALVWLSLHRVSPGLIRAGTKTEISGTVTNRSLTQAIEVDPLEAEHEGNAGGGELVSDTSTVRPDGVQLPFQGKIAPGETVDVTGQVYTAVEPETLGKITYEPSGVVLLADGSSTALTASQIGASAGSTQFAIGTEAGEPALPAATLETVLDHFSDAAVKGVGQWSVNELSAAGNLLLHPISGAYGIGKGIAAFAVGGGHAVADASYFVGMVAMLAVAGESMTPVERGEFANQIVADFEASHLKADYALVANAAGKVLGSFEEAVRTGDYNQVGALAGGTLATGLTAAADALLSDIAFQKITIGMKYAGKAAAKSASGGMANAIVLADSIRDAKATATLGKTLKGIDAGTNLLLDGAAALRNSFGLTSKQITELRNYCQRSKIIIAVRSRSARAAELIKKGLAVGKNEIIKLKAVNQYDVEFLGYRPSNINEVVWAEPLSEQEVVDELIRRKASPETEKIVLERLKLRQDEWKDPHIRHVIEDAAKKKSIDWSFDGSGNGAPGANKKQIRRFELKNQPSPVKGTGKRTYQEVLVGNKPGLHPSIRAVPITQDVDLMALLRSDGSIMSAAERVTAYIHLSDILGIEHGETPTWIKDGEIMFQKKAKQLADVIPGGEQLAVFAPTGDVTAGFFNPALTIFDNVTKGGRIFFQGGYNNPYSKIKTQIELALKGMG